MGGDLNGGLVGVLAFLDGVNVDCALARVIGGFGDAVAFDE